MGSGATLGFLRGEGGVVIGLISGSHVFNHLYLVLFPPIIGVLATEFEVGLAAIGFAMGLQAFTSMLLQLPFGYLADSYDRTLSLALCLGLGALGVAILAVAPSFAWLVVGQVVLGAGVAGHHPVHFPLMADASPERTRGRAYSLHGLAGNVGFAIAPVLILGIASVPAWTWRHAYGLVAVLGAGYTLVTVYWFSRHVDASIRRPNREADGTESPIAGMLAEVRGLTAVPAVLLLGGVVLAAQTALWGLTSFVVVFLQEVYGVTSGVAGLTLTGIFVVGAGLILAGGVLSDRYSAGRILGSSYVLVGGAIGLLASRVVPVPVAIAAAIAAGSLFSLGIPARDKLTDVLSRRRSIGRNFAVVTIGIMLGNTIAPPLFGSLIQRVGYRLTFEVIAVVALIAAAGAFSIAVGRDRSVF